MRLFAAGTYKSAALVLAFLLSSPALAQYDGGGTEPSLRSVFASKPKDMPTPNHVIVELSEKKLFKLYPELKGLQPADSQQDLTDILQKVGANASILLDSIPDIVGQEDVVQEHLDKKGFATGLPLYSGKYKYLVMAHAAGSAIRLNEIRINPTSATGGSLLAQGFGLLALQFHPFHQGAARFRYLGRQTVDSLNAYVVAYAQDRDKSQLTGILNVEGGAVRVAYQGIAWINPDNFQIVRMRTDLLQPPAGTGSQATEVQLSEVRLSGFPPLWLPQKLVVTRSAVGNALREKHEFSGWKRSIVEFKSPSKTEQPAEKTKEKP